jgi:quercetin dioxygenase-like cupin family protein
MSPSPSQNEIYSQLIMTVRPLMNRSLRLALAALMWGGSGELLRGQTLMQEPLGKTSKSTMTLFVTTLPPGHEVPTHQHGGAVFIYVLEGEIESQVEPDPPKIYRAGDVFYEPPLHTHRFYRNLSETEPAELLVFQVREKGKPLAVGAK